MKLDHLPIVLTLIAAYTLVLFYMFRLGFFSIVGFEFADMVGGWDALSNLGVLALYCGALFGYLLIVAMIVQTMEDRWSAAMARVLKHSSALQVSSAVAGLLIVAIGSWYGRLDLGLLGLALPLMTSIFTAYARLQTAKTIAVWDIVLSFVGVAILVGLAGVITAADRLTDPNPQLFRVEIRDGAPRIGSVIFSSPTGILMLTDVGPTLVSASSVVAATRLLMREVED
jgi:hypothetical protein